MKKHIFILIFLVNSAFCAGLGVYGNGNERIPLTAQAMAVGNAVSANPEYAIVWQNPAKLAFANGFQFAIGNTIRTLDRYENFLSGEYKIPNKRVGIGGAFSYKGIAGLDSLRKDGEVYSSTNYINMTTKIGVGTILSAKWSLGFGVSWYYSKIPVDFVPESHTIKTNSSSTLGGLSFMGMYKNKNLSISFGARDIFSYSDWSYKDASFSNGTISTVTDTMPLLFVAAAQYEFEIADTQKVKISADFNGYLINSFFNAYEHTALATNYGFEWSPNLIITFRTGIRDILINRNLFVDRPLLRDENNPRLGFGIGVNLESIPNWSMSKKFAVNYAVSNSGAQAGLEHCVDLVFKW
ncbi:MAG: hypothetical protein FWF51_00165 [Chitinivibrionia bacterium]|nr:hypothetical protein [Chitinivibrionia bacterium]